MESKTPNGIGDQHGLPFQYPGSGAGFNLRVFFPSSIAVLGRTPDQPRSTPCFNRKRSMASARWRRELRQYFHQKYGVDVRSVRYPGIIGYQSLPGEGTTDYAVDIFIAPSKEKPSNASWNRTPPPMMYMPDAIRATLELMEAPGETVKIRSSYNLAGTNFTPAEIAREIQNTCLVSR